MTEEQLALIRAADERNAIVLKYDRGREDGQQIDPWEDPTFEIYHVTDRYGFIHDKRLPTSQRIEDRDRELENSRLKKWSKTIHPNSTKLWERDTKSGKLKKRLYKGVPDAVRGEVWSRLLHIRKTKEEQKGKYEEMRALARQWSPDLRQIDLDVNRTYRDHLMFRERYGLKQQALFHVLGAYSVYNAEIGYCQGMSQIAALLLMYLNEEDAFWGLSNLMADSKWAMHGFFIPGFPKLIRFQQQHDKIFGKFLPKLKKHFDRQNIDAGLYTLKWFFQCFLDRVPFSLALRLWDIYLMDGENILLATSYGLLKMHRRSLSRMGMEEIVEFLQIRLAQNFGYSDNEAVENVAKCLEEMQRAKLDYSPNNKQIPTLEQPQKPFGIFEIPSVEAAIGRRRLEFSDEERTARAAVVARMAEQQARSHQPGSYLSIDDVSFDPSIDDVSSHRMRGSERSSLAGTSAATSAADISTLSATASHRLLYGVGRGRDDDEDSNSRVSVISIEREDPDGDGQHTPTTVTEFAVVHVHRSPGGQDILILPPPFPATTEGDTSTTPTGQLLPAPPLPFTNSFHNGGQMSTAEADHRVRHSSGRSKEKEERNSPAKTSVSSPDRVRIYVPYSDDSRPTSPPSLNGTSNGLLPSSSTPIPPATPTPTEDPHRVVIRIEANADVGDPIMSSSSSSRRPRTSKSKSPVKKAAAASPNKRHSDGSRL